MEEMIETTIDAYYKHKRPFIKDVQVLDMSPDIMCLRWKETDRTVTVKSMLVEGKHIINEIK